MGCCESGLGSATKVPVQLPCFHNEHADNSNTEETDHPLFVLKTLSQETELQEISKWVKITGTGKRNQAYAVRKEGTELAFVTRTICAHPEKLGPVLIKTSQKLTSLLKDESAQVPVMQLLFLGFKSNDPQLRQVFLFHNLLEELLRLMSSPTRKVQLLSALVTASFYRNYNPGQQEFVAKGGCAQLLELLYQESEEGDSFLSLLGCVEDLVYVCVDGKHLIVHKSIEALFDAKFFKLLESLDFRRLSATVCKKLESLTQLFPPSE